MHDESFGQQLRRLRRSRDLTQEALAELAGCAVDTLRAIENGRRRPSRELAAILAERLAVPMAERPAFLEFARSGGSAPAPLAQPIAPPPAAAPLIGRAGELELLTRRLSEPACRMLTLTGPGGIGKTSLSAELVARSAENFPDGVLTLAFAGMQHPPEAVSAVAAALGLRPEHDQGAIEQIVAVLAPRRQLIVLDNLEHLLGGPELLALIAAILSGAPGVRLLVTSRERLRLREEWVYELGGLAIEGAAPASDAALLFAERARRVQGDFTLSPANAAAVDAICRLVGGTPLAIELAASWLPTLSPAEIAAELERNLDLLGSDARDLPARHRSVRTVFEGSWRLLTPDEQRLLARLALFRGSFTREAAEFVAGIRLPQLAALMQKSLIRRQDERYQIHELIRQFAAERLANLGDAERTEQRFMDYYQALAAGTALAFVADGRRLSIDPIWMEYDNLRVALRLAVTQQQGDAGANFCSNMRTYWAMRGLVREGLQWTRQFLALPQLSSRSRGLLHGVEVALLQLQSMWGEALTAAKHALSLLEPGVDDLAREAALTGAAMAALDAGDYAQARTYLHDCVSLDRMLGSTFYEAATLTNLGNTYLYEGDLIEAQHYYHAARELALEVGAELVVAYTDYALGTVAALEGDQTGAGLLRRALPVMHGFGYLLLITHCLEALAAHAGVLSEHERAGLLFGAAEQLRSDHQLVVTPGIQPLYVRLAALARGPLNDDAWEQARSAGRRLNQDAAIRLVLGERQ